MRPIWTATKLGFQHAAGGTAIREWIIRTSVSAILFDISLQTA